MEETSRPPSTMFAKMARSSSPDSGAESQRETLATEGAGSVETTTSGLSRSEERHSETSWVVGGTVVIGAADGGTTEGAPEAKTSDLRRRARRRLRARTLRRAAPLVAERTGAGRQGSQRETPESFDGNSTP